MKVYFETNDIHDALKDRLKGQISINEDTTEVDIEIKNGRGENGPTAILDIVPKGTIAARRAAEAAEAAEKAANKQKDAPKQEGTDPAPTTEASNTASADASAEAAPAAEGGAKAPGSLFG